MDLRKAQENFREIELEAANATRHFNNMLGEFDLPQETKVKLLGLYQQGTQAYGQLMTASLILGFAETSPSAWQEYVEREVLTGNLGRKQA